MAFLHKDSKPATVPELELFDIGKTQTAVEQRYMIDCRPMSAVSEGSVVEFVVAGDNRDYLATTESTLVTTVRVMHQDGTKLHLQESAIDGQPDETSAVDEKAVPVNNVVHALFSQVDVFFNGNRMTQATNMYPYKAAFQTLLYNSSDTKKTRLLGGGFYPETSANLDELTVENPSYAWRHKLFKGSKLVQLETPLLEDVMQVKKYLLNGVRVQIKLYPSSRKFCIMSDDATKEYKIEIVDIVFRACMIKVNPGVIIGHASAMEKSNALYPYTRVETKSYSISKDSSNVNLDNMFQGTRPSKIVFGFVASNAFNGDYKRNPFKFNHYSVTDVKMVVDGQTVPGPSPKLDFDAFLGTQFTHAYANMYDSLGTSGGADMYAGGITPDRFAHGHTIFVYNLEPMPPSDEYINLKRHANVRLEINFADPLPETVTLTLYAEYYDYFAVDTPRNIIKSE
jgi:hypothetical protein